jgi:hypothetical protein
MLPLIGRQAVPDPWDAPPFPKRGNHSRRVLYESIGRALSTWEELESTLARLYAAFCGKDQYDTEANHAYGTELNFRNRLTELQRSACRYFIKRPHQDLEGDLAWVVRYATGYSRRRNDVAHGVVRLLHMVLDPRQGFLSAEPGWCLVPPHFREDKFSSPTLPDYILTSREINRFANAFWPLVRRAHALSDTVELPHYASRRRSAVPPPWPV